jgi:hypothetical protein
VSTSSRSGKIRALDEPRNQSRFEDREHFRSYRTWLHTNASLLGQKRFRETPGKGRQTREDRSDRGTSKEQVVMGAGSH